tara:strand:+ start:107 stop:247 length:141 start_codon:yes stop_codon:yes gene_type:complete
MFWGQPQEKDRVGKPLPGFPALTGQPEINKKQAFCADKKVFFELTV